MTMWQREWIPVFSSSAHDTLYVTYRDALTGLLWWWTRETYVPARSYLEGLADALEHPAQHGSAP
ncbi:hypothetical protein [Streptomyces sp. NPDC001604]|uniref:hypothetical protein n=1 Tax=Streptomyces sp. NPDC001604 TaxID=3364593 RepID=UPI00368D5DF4